MRIKGQEVTKGLKIEVNMQGNFNAFLRLLLSTNKSVPTKSTNFHHNQHVTWALKVPVPVISSTCALALLTLLKAINIWYFVAFRYLEENLNLQKFPFINVVIKLELLK